MSILLLTIRVNEKEAAGKRGEHRNSYPSAFTPDTLRGAAGTSAMIQLLTSSCWQVKSDSPTKTDPKVTARPAREFRQFSQVACRDHAARPQDSNQLPNPARHLRLQ
jgi:hypothetical protein